MISRVNLSNWRVEFLCPVKQIAMDGQENPQRQCLFEIELSKLIQLADIALQFLAVYSDSPSTVPSHGIYIYMPMPKFATNQQ
jgi:hypothetical protein